VAKSESRLARLKAGKRNTKVVAFPGSDDQVALRPLTLAERQAAVFAAEGVFQSAGVKFDVATSDAYADEVSTQVLALALRDPDDPDKSFASSADELRRNLSLDEKTALIELYNEFEEDCSPRLGEVTDEEFKSLLSEVKKSPESLNFLNSSTLRRLALSLVSELATSQKGSGSTS